MEVTEVTAKVATGPERFENSENRGEYLENFWPQGLERLTPPTHAYKQRGGGVSD